jgi:hypothetical protein
VFAEVLGVSIDELAGTKPLKSITAGRTHPRLWLRFRQIEKLPLRERKELFSVIDAYLDRHRLTQIAKAS